MHSGCHSERTGPRTYCRVPQRALLLFGAEFGGGERRIRGCFLPSIGHEIPGRGVRDRMERAGLLQSEPPGGNPNPLKARHLPFPLGVELRNASVLKVLDEGRKAS
jgi:hypothetical protein